MTKAFAIALLKQDIQNSKINISYRHNEVEIKALELAIKALEQYPNRCDSCTHSEEQDGSNCYECIKGMADNFEAQPTDADCISRAEALDAIEKEKQGWEGSERYAIDECHTRIAELPSVTLKIDGEYTFSQAYDMGYEEGVDVGYTRGYTEAMSDITEGE